MLKFIDDKFSIDLKLLIQTEYKRIPRSLIRQKKIVIVNKNVNRIHTFIMNKMFI